MGYIGSHTIVDLMENGFEVVSIDNFSRSKPQALDRLEKTLGRKVENASIDLCDASALEDFFDKHSDIVGVIHFAAYILVDESVENPLLYYQNNVLGLLNLLAQLEKRNISNLVFSSSCSVYGNVLPEQLPVSETTAKGEAQSPYAFTKVLGERIITDWSKANACHKSILLRYFNPAGAHDGGHLGEDPTHHLVHLVPVIVETALGRRKQMTVFGSDYPTRDGSCVRDYIHVMDLAHAHTLALRHLLQGRQETPTEVFNLGMGEGVTVLEAIRSFEKISGQALNYQLGPRRAGDVVAVYADPSKAKQVLGWQPNRGIDEIMRSAWAWEKARNS
jgi:UDP-glucose 4-epimerase